MFFAASLFTLGGISRDVASRSDDEQTILTLSSRVAGAESRADVAEKAKAEAVRAANIASMMANSAHRDAAKLHERTITPEQRFKFVNALTNATKKAVWVICDDSSGVGRRLALSLREMLNDAGFSIDNKDEKSHPKISGTSDGGLIYPLSPVLNGKGAPDIVAVLAFCPLDASTQPPHAVALFEAFTAARLGCQPLMIRSNFLAGGEVAIIVP